MSNSQKGGLVTSHSEESVNTIGLVDSIWHDIPDVKDSTGHLESSTIALLSPAGMPAKELQELEHTNRHQTPGRPNHTSWSIFQAWWVEMCCCVLSIACMVLIILILLRFSGRPTYFWPFEININSVLSAIVTILRLSLSYLLATGLSQLKWSWFKGTPRKLKDISTLDDASRGPSGALRVLLTKLGFNLASLGCLLVLVSLAIGPVTQLLVTIKTGRVERFKNLPDIATIPICSYDYIDHALGSGLIEEDDTYYFPTLPTMGAIYQGLFQRPADFGSDHSIRCITDNCTFGRYHSLGICSKCSDLTDQILAYNRRTNTIVPRHQCGLEAEGGSWACAYRLPDGLVLDPHSWKTFNASTSGNPEALGDRIKISNLTALHHSFVHFNDSSTGGSLDDNITAIGCELSYCVRSYSTEVIESTPNEVADEVPATVERIKDPSTGDEDWKILPERCEDSFGQEYSFRMRYPNITGCPHSVPLLTAKALSNAFSYFLTGKSEWNQNREQLIWKTTTSAIADWDGMEHTQRKIEDLALSLTHHFRNNDKICTGSTLGQAWSFEYRFCIRWMWLSLPIATTLLTCAFLISIILQSRKQSFWKSSPLPIFFSGYASGVKAGLVLGKKGQEGIDLDAVLPRDIRQFEKAARRIEVNLDAHQGLKVVKVDGETFMFTEK